MSSYYRTFGAEREIYTDARMGLEALTLIAGIVVTTLVFVKPRLNNHAWGRWVKAATVCYLVGRVSSTIYWAIIVSIQYGATDLSDETALLNGSYAMINIDALFAPTAAVLAFVAVMWLSSDLHGSRAALVRNAGLVLALLLEITILVNWSVSIAVSARTAQVAGKRYTQAEATRINRELNDLASKQIRAAWAMDIMDVIVMVVGVGQSLFVLIRRKAANGKSPAILCFVAALMLLLRATYGLSQSAQNYNPLTGKYWGPRYPSYSSYILGIILAGWPVLVAIVCLFAAGKRLRGPLYGHGQPHVA